MTKPAYPCRVPSCHHTKPCPEHPAKASKRPQRSFTSARRTETGFYATARWRALKGAHLREHPFCVTRIHASPYGGIPMPGRVVDHIRPHRGEGELFWDPDNLQTLCNRCHNVKTAGEIRGRRGYAKRRKT